MASIDVGYEEKVNIKQPSKPNKSIWSCITNVSKWPELIKLQNKSTSNNVFEVSCTERCYDELPNTSLKSAVDFNKVSNPTSTVNSSSPEINNLTTVNISDQEIQHVTPTSTLEIHNNYVHDKQLLFLARAKRSRYLNNPKVCKSRSESIITCSQTNTEHIWIKNLNIKKKFENNKNHNPALKAKRDVLLLNNKKQVTQIENIHIMSKLLDKIKGLELQISHLQSLCNSCSTDKCDIEIITKSKLLKNIIPQNTDLKKIITVKEPPSLAKSSTTPLSESELKHKNKKHEVENTVKTGQVIIKEDTTNCKRDIQNAVSNNGSINGKKIKSKEHINKKEKVMLTKMVKTSSDVIENKDKKQKQVRNQKINSTDKDVSDTTNKNPKKLLTNTVKDDKSLVNEITSPGKEKSTKIQNINKIEIKPSVNKNVKTNTKNDKHESNKDTVLFLVNKIRHLESKLYKLTETVNDSFNNNRNEKKQIDMFINGKSSNSRETVSWQISEEFETKTEAKELKGIIKKHKKQVALQVVHYPKTETNCLTYKKSTCSMLPLEEYSATNVPIHADKYLKDLKQIVPTNSNNQSTQINKHYLVSMSASDTSVFNQRIKQMPIPDTNVTVTEILSSSIISKVHQYPLCYKHNTSPAKCKFNLCTEHDLDDQPTKDTQHKLVKTLSPMTQLASVTNDYESSNANTDVEDLDMNAICLSEATRVDFNAQQINDKHFDKKESELTDNSLERYFKNICESDSVLGLRDDKKILQREQNYNFVKVNNDCGDNAIINSEQSSRFVTLKNYIPAKERMKLEDSIVKSVPSKQFPYNNTNKTSFPFSLNVKKDDSSWMSQSLMNDDNQLKKEREFLLPASLQCFSDNYKPCFLSEKIYGGSFYKDNQVNTTDNRGDITKQHNSLQYMSENMLSESFNEVEDKPTLNMFPQNFCQKKKSTTNVIESQLLEMRAEETLDVEFKSREKRSKSTCNIKELTEQKCSSFDEMDNKLDVSNFEISNNTVAYLVLVDKPTFLENESVKKTRFTEDEMRKLVVSLRNKIDDFIYRKEKIKLASKKLNDLQPYINKKYTVNYQISETYKNRLVKVKSEELFQNKIHGIEMKTIDCNEDKIIDIKKLDQLNPTEGKKRKQCEINKIKNTLKADESLENESDDNLSIGKVMLQMNNNEENTTNIITCIAEVVNDNNIRNAAIAESCKNVITSNKKTISKTSKKAIRHRSKSLDPNQKEKKTKEIKDLEVQYLENNLEMAVTPKNSSESKSKLEKNCDVSFNLNNSKSCDEMTTCQCVKTGLNVCFPAIDLNSDKEDDSDKSSAKSGIYQKFIAFIKRTPSNEDNMNKKIKELKQEIILQRTEVNQLKSMWSKCSSQIDDFLRNGKSNRTSDQRCLQSEDKVSTSQAYNWNAKQMSNTNHFTNDATVLYAFQSLTDSSCFLSEGLIDASLNFPAVGMNEKPSVLHNKKVKKHKRMRINPDSSLRQNTKKYDSYFSFSSNSKFEGNISASSSRGTQTSTTDKSQRRVMLCSKRLRMRNTHSNSAITADRKMHFLKRINPTLEPIQRKNNKVFIRDSYNESIKEQTKYKVME